MCSPISVIFEYVVRNRFLFLAKKELLLHQRIFLAYCVNDHLSSQSNVQLKHTTDELVKKKKIQCLQESGKSTRSVYMKFYFLQIFRKIKTSDIKMQRRKFKSSCLLRHIIKIIKAGENLSSIPNN